MTPAEMKDALKTVDTLVTASARRPAGTRPLMDRGGCTHPACTRCGSRPRTVRR